jgi:hypothetical protein
MQAVPNFGNFGYAACGGRLSRCHLRATGCQSAEIRVQASDFQPAFIQKGKKLEAWAASNKGTKLSLMPYQEEKNWQYCVEICGLAD